MFPEVEMRFPKQLVREPLIDVIDQEKTIEVMAELPGVDKKDIEVNVNEDSVSLAAEQKQEVKQEQEQKGYYFHERSFQKFYRKIPLPAEVIPEKTNAEFKAGILKLTLQKKKPVVPEKAGFKVELK
jgi:HSP20 family protein